MKRLGWTALALGLAPLRALSCAVCFGSTPETKGLLDGFWWGILILLGATMFLVTGIGWAIWKVEKRRTAQAPLS